MVMIAEEAAKDDTSIEEACRRAFARSHEEVRRNKTTAGTTATLLLYDHQSRQLLCSNVGDSAALLVTRSGHQRLSTDHQLQYNVDEQERVRSAGGKVAFAKDPQGFPTGPLRLWPGGLAMSRAIGDGDCGALVLCEPAFCSVKVPAEGAVAVACSDGVWNALAEPRVAQIVRSAIAAAPKRGEASSPAKRAADQLVAAALKEKGLHDDITAVVMLAGFAGLVPPQGTEPQPGAAAPSPPSSPCRSDSSPTAPSGRKVGCWQQLRRSRTPDRKMDMTMKGGAPFPKIYHGYRSVQQSFSARVSSGGDGSFSKQRSPSPSSPRRKVSSALAAAAAADVPTDATRHDPAERTRSGATSEVRADGKLVGIPSQDLPPPPEGVPIYNFNDLGDRGLCDMTFLGSGEFCSVFRSVLNGAECAVKMLRNDKVHSLDARHGLEFEMHLMCRLRHENLLRALGASRERDFSKQFLVLEMLDGVLADLLPPPPTASLLERRAAVRRWPMLRALRYGLDLAMALQFCHDEAFEGYRLLHRDVKPKNMGIRRGRLVLFDFGVSKLVRRDQPAWRDGANMTGMVGSLRYMAPEVAQSRRYNHKSEAYSFGIVLWEMLAHQRPYEGMTSDVFEASVCVGGKRPKIDRSWPEPVRTLLAATFEADFQRRPEFALVVDDMQALVASASFSARPTTPVSRPHSPGDEAERQPEGAGSVPAPPPQTRGAGASHQVMTAVVPEAVSRVRRGWGTPRSRP